ncbi:MAG TPA: DCC1-like thiol-disulfide oxidoreductase family protein, partial [Candidatus Limnocylindria bacterium]|nr:DCC1-like thiol-disulfide oxidoreductase family protein [Candidatus Limnocylindria bacterium]
MSDLGGARLSRRDPLPARPMLIYDGECRFCRQWIRRWRRLIGDRVEYAPYRAVAHRFPEIPIERFQRAVQLVEPGGRWSQGAEAVFRSLAARPESARVKWSWCAWPLWLYQHVPGFAPASEWGYRLVADHRGLLSRLTRS